MIHSDVNSMYLSSTEPPAAAEWACLLRPLRGREPEGIWNLLSIVREMFKRRDSNAAPLLEILTEQCLTYEQVCPQHRHRLKVLKVKGTVCKDFSNLLTQVNVFVHK